MRKTSVSRQYPGILLHIQEGLNARETPDMAGQAPREGDTGVHQVLDRYLKD